MNGPNTPLRPDTLDELLSADIDGELERAAADLGLTLDDARTAIAAPDAVARRAALVRARDLVAPAVPLDPADTDRLVAAALDGVRAENELAAARRRRNRFDAGRRIAIAAASIVVIFGAIAVLARGTTTSSNSKSANSSSAPTTVEFGAPEAGPASSALGDVSSADALRAKVLQRLPARVHVPAAKSAGAPAYGNGSSKGGAFDAAGGVKTRQLALAALIGPRGPRGVAVPESAGRERAASTGGPSRADCAALLVQRGGVPPAPVFSAAATSGGRPVYVVVFRSASGYSVYVLRAADCSVLRRAAV